MKKQQLHFCSSRVKYLNLIFALGLLIIFKIGLFAQAPKIVIEEVDNDTYKEKSKKFYKIVSDFNDNWLYSLDGQNFDKKATRIDTNWAFFENINKISKKIWFKKNIEVDSFMLGKTVVLSIKLHGKAKIYANGQLMHDVALKLKKRAAGKSFIQNYSNPYPISFDKLGPLQITIAYELPTQLDLLKKVKQKPMTIKMKLWEDYLQRDMNESRAETSTQGMVFGMLLMMALLHFSFYWFFRQSKYNILLCVAMILFGLHIYLSNNTYYYNSSWGYFVDYTIQISCTTFGYLLLLWGIFDYIGQKKGLWFWFMAALIISVNICQYFKWTSNWVSLLIKLGIIIVFLIWIFKESKKNNIQAKALKNAFQFLFIALAVWILIVIIYTTFSTLYGEINSSPQLYFIGSITGGLIQGFGPQLAISGSVCFSLAVEFIKNNKLLNQKIGEIEQLSKEKEDLLQAQNIVLEQQVAERTNALETSLQNLKLAQNQLVQSEKLASLGELTAGIAHEIQNPLNFVNNFAEVNKELSNDLAVELNKPNPEKKYLEELLQDLNLNNEKIGFHGQRASSIVKGMLDHSKKSTGLKEAVDMNQLVGEYLRLSYHGLRAKDKTFNAKFDEDLDPHLPKITVLVQEIGRVLLNLINNAFYAAIKKQKDGSTDMPIVRVSTKKLDKHIEIKVEDNGGGIPLEIRDKIFQPFFTTKPSGEGTGLGLSLTYDIVTKGHNGTIKVDSEVNEGTCFTVTLPITTD